MYVVVFVLVAYYLKWFQGQRMFVMVWSCILPFVGLLVMSMLPNEPKNKWIKWGMFDMTVIFSLSLFLGWSLSEYLASLLPGGSRPQLTNTAVSVTSNIAGGTKRTVVSSLSLVAYCGGNMAGAQVFQTKDAPRYLTGTIACCACFGAQILLVIAWRLWYMYENRRRDRQAAEAGLSEEDRERLGRQLGEQDVTDRNNPHFRYAM
jgi:ACS family allantoate permease-like MFS transporter